MDGYIKAYTEANLEAEKDIFPEFYLKANEKYINQEALTKEKETAEEKIGKNFTITYKIDKETIMTDEELKEFNKKTKEKIENAIDATECYTYEGSVEFKGSKDKISSDFSTVARCKYDGKWYIIRK